MPRVVLAMSGGVDSSAAAKLLLDDGYDVVGLFMRSGETDAESVCRTDLPVISTASHKQGCCSASDSADARRVADALDIPFHAVNFENSFGRIKDYFADEYLAGRTPNPCVMCNNWLKFGKLWDFARTVGADRISTGHYAGLVDVGEDRPALVRGLDRGKDQSYVLFGIDRDLLDRILFPVGSHEKPAIRELARETGLRVHDKADSQEICFIPDNDYAGFIERYRGESDTAGEMVDTAGNVVATHAGYERFTVGQRKGLGVAFGEPRFVVAIEPESKRVVLGTREDLAGETLTATGANWLVEDVPTSIECAAKIRYRGEPSPCEVTVTDADRFEVRFHEPQYAIAPGQAVVLYDGDRVLGGGWIR